MNNKTRGFSFVEVVIILVVVVIVGALGYAAWKSFLVPNASVADKDTVSNSQTVEVITSKEDLEAAEKALEDLDFDDESAKQAELQAQL